MEWKQLECMCTPPSFQDLDNSASGIIVWLYVFVIISHLLTDAICHNAALEWHVVVPPDSSAPSCVWLTAVTCCPCSVRSAFNRSKRLNHGHRTTSTYFKLQTNKISCFQQNSVRLTHQFHGTEPFLVELAPAQVIIFTRGRPSSPEHHNLTPSFLEYPFQYSSPIYA